MNAMGIVFLLAPVLIAACFLGILESGATDVFLEATRPDFQKIPIGVVGFKDQELDASQGERVAQVLAADLKRSHLFTVTDLSSLGLGLDGVWTGAAGADRTKLKSALDQGVGVLVWGTLGLRRTDLVLDGYVYDGGMEEVVVGKRYVGAQAVLRLMAHRLADELVFRYTGEQGIARTKIAYVAEQGGGRELFVMDYDGYEPRQITVDGSLNLMPRWSPDRRFLVFTAYRSRNRQDIDMVELATGKRWTLISLPGLNITPMFSPDGSRVAFATSRDGNSELYLLNLQTRTFERLTAHPGADLSPSWSPTGREIAFASDRGGGPQIYLMSLDGSNVRRLTFDGDYNAAPAWSPRGDWIAYVCRNDEKLYKLCLISPDGRKRVQITTGRGVDDSPSWSPDGRHLVFSSAGEGKSHIYMINSDGRDLERLTSGGTYHGSPSWSPV